MDPALTEYDLGFLVGLLIGEGHFGGDGRQPQITLRMHTRHIGVFAWLTEKLPYGRLYGPYDHGGRRYYQWMVRGPALRDGLLPLIAPRIAAVDAHCWARVTSMCSRYHIVLPSVSPSSVP